MKSFSRLGVILIGLAIFGYAEVWGEDWKPYGSSENCLGFYGTQSITRPSKSIVRVRLRWDMTEKAVLRWVEKYGKIYENFSYSIILQEINCAEKKWRGLSMTLYDNKENVISSSSSPSKWDFIIPESMAELLYKEVCK